MNLALSLGTERPEMQRGEGPAAGDPGLHLPVPGPAAWHLMTPPPGAEWRVAPRGLTHALCERPPLRGQARGGRDRVPSRGNRGPSPGGHTRCGRRTSPGRLRHDTGSDTCRGRDRHLGGSAVCQAGAEGGAGGGVLALPAVGLCLSELPFCFVPCQQQCGPRLASLRGRASNHDVPNPL